MSGETLPFWERPEIVDRFAGREPDHRLSRLVGLYPSPPRVRVLDLGSAGGRNAVFLAGRGFDLTAVDSSRAMVERTRSRLAEVIGESEAARRVHLAPMDRLDFLEDRSMDLVVALGVLHAAASREEWDRALGEVRRVLSRGGRLLTADHSPEFDPEGKGLIPVPGCPHLFDGRSSGRSYLLHEDEHDREFAARGFLPLVPTGTVRRKTDAGGWRVTVNALYVRR